MTKTVDALPRKWVVFKPDEFFEKQFGIQIMVPYSKKVMWGLTDKGQAFMKAHSTTLLVHGNGLKSLATNGRDVWAIDQSNNLVFRTGIDDSTPEGVSWKVVKQYSPYKKIYSGPAGHFIGK